MQIGRGWRALLLVQLQRCTTETWGGGGLCRLPPAPQHYPFGRANAKGRQAKTQRLLCLASPFPSAHCFLLPPSHTNLHHHTRSDRSIDRIAPRFDSPCAKPISLTNPPSSTIPLLSLHHTADCACAVLCPVETRDSIAANFSDPPNIASHHHHHISLHTHTHTSQQCLRYSPDPPPRAAEAQAAVAAAASRLGEGVAPVLAPTATPRMTQIRRCPPSRTRVRSAS